MTIAKLMSTEVERCTPDTDLAAAAMIMWRTDCGIVPVVERESNRLAGVITDRDICMAAGTKHQAACCIPVGDVMARTVVTCHPSDSLRTALARMAEHRVRRVPVVDDKDGLVGVLSIADLIHAIGSPDRATGVSAEDVVSTLRSICRSTSGEKDLVGAGAGDRAQSSVPVGAGRRSART